MVLGDGAFVIRVPQTEELVLIVQNGKDWPDTQGLRIVIDERAHTLTDGPCTETFPDDGRPRWDAAKRVLTIFLRKGHIARLRYSSFVDKRFIDAMGLPRWSNTDAQRNFIAVMALLGVHWMITPYRSLVLVHATQQPVCTPVLQKVSAPRTAGQTFTDLDGSVRLHGPSTGKFEVVAEWHEWFDDPQQPRPVRKADARHARRDPADREPRQRVHAGQRRQRGAGGTGHRPARQRRQAHTRQPARVRRYQVPPGALPHRGDDALSRVPAGSAVCAARPDHAPGARGAGDEGAARRRQRPGHRGALRRGRRHAQRHARAQHPGPRGAARGVQRAHLPLVANVGPNVVAQSSTRYGNGLRVYLERPWFSSGDGELLGVVLLSDGAKFDAIPEDMMPFVTQWGLDPLFDTTLPKEMCKASDFSARVASETLPLLENNASVHVVGHRVQWDDARKLWYCDIELDAGWRTYMPFVRLALVRYQPHAIGGMKLSRVTLAEFAQVLPRRSVTVQRAAQVQTVKVRGPVPHRGPMTYTNDSTHLNISFIPPGGSVLESGRNKMELVLQTRSASLDSDLAWSDAATLASSLALPPGATVESTPGMVVVRGAGGAPSLFDEAARSAPTSITRTGSLGELQKFEDHIALHDAARAGVSAMQVTAATSATTAAGLQAQLAQQELIDPVIWQASVTLPAYSGKGRLVLREFERYYTDRTIPDRRGDVVYRKRVVEERLVYTEFFPLN
jgi:hypothetical protein